MAPVPMASSDTHGCGCAQGHKSLPEINPADPDFVATAGTRQPHWTLASGRTRLVSSRVGPRGVAGQGGGQRG